MAARLVVFEPSTVCACAQVLARHWKSISTHQLTTQKFTFPKYGHCDANGESFQIFGDAALLSKKDNRRPSVVSRGSFLTWRNWHKRRQCFGVPPLKPFTWSPYYLLQTVYCSLCKRGNGGLKRSKSCYFVIVGSPTPQKKSFVNVFPSKSSKIMSLRFNMPFLCGELPVLWDCIDFFSSQYFAESHHVHIQCTL